MPKSKIKTRRTKTRKNNKMKSKTVRKSIRENGRRSRRRSLRISILIMWQMASRAVLRLACSFRRKRIRVKRRVMARQKIRMVRMIRISEINYYDYGYYQFCRIIPNN